MRFGSLVLAIVLWFISAAAYSAGVPVVNTHIDKAKITVGDQTTLKIEVTADSGSLIRFPKRLEGFEIIDSHTSTGGIFDKNTLVKWYRLRTFKAGAIDLSDLRVGYKNSGSTVWEEVLAPKVGIEVDSVLGKDGGELRDIKGPIKTFPDIPYLIIGGLLLAAVAGYFLYKYLKGRKKGGDMAVVLKFPAHVTAMDALLALKVAGYIERGMFKEYYIELSSIVRSYLEGRFDLRAVEMTTEEFMERARHSNLLTREQKGLLREFLNLCDIVKFAKYGPSETQAGESLDAAERFIKETAGV